MSAPYEGKEPVDQVAELPGGSAIAGHYVNAILTTSHHQQGESNSVPASPISARPSGDYTSEQGNPRAHFYRRPSASSSRVPIDFFDKEGVKELRRSLTSQSNALAQAAERALAVQAVVEQEAVPVPSGSSQLTAVSESDKFDLEKFLSDIVSQCVNPSTTSFSLF